MNIFRILLPIGVLGTAIGIAAYLMATKPEPKRHPKSSSMTSVQAVRLESQDYQVRLRSYGTVSARTRSTLISEISGKILGISPSFREGGFFEEGDLLIEIEPYDYETAVMVAESALAQVQNALEQEEARHQQAIEDWNRLGDGGQPTALTLRKPQLAQTQAAVSSAESRVGQAKRNLERTRITAPYAGRIMKKQVDVGQFVTPGTVLAVIFAVDYAEIRIPLTNQQLDYIDLPEEYRGQGEVAAVKPVSVKLHGKVGIREVVWEGSIIRAEGVFDTRSRHLFVVAQVVDPYGKNDSGRPPLRVGQYVTAEIFGKVLKNVFVIPKSSVYPDEEVLLIDSNSKIQRTKIQPLEGIHAEDVDIVKDGFQEGDVLCITSLPFAANGAQVMVHIEGEPPPIPVAGRKGQKPKK
ncbi:MAG TPA: efflux RND transporter periplasmic adaptor subunit [Verrucomicrobiales bacterium]|nr:efflux RND transporter periplasmic adaptor subunit [Verrucomicrobiales bacterium]